MRLRCCWELPYPSQWVPGSGSQSARWSRCVSALVKATPGLSVLGMATWFLLVPEFGVAVSVGAGVAVLVSVGFEVDVAVEDAVAVWLGLGVDVALAVAVAEAVAVEELVVVAVGV